jgi:hypothetical protein
MVIATVRGATAAEVETLRQKERPREEKISGTPPDSKDEKQQ